MRDLVELQGAAHFEAEAAAEEDEGNVVEGVAVALAEFVGPDDQRVIEHRRALAAGFRRRGEAVGEVADFAGEPGVDLDEFFLRGLVGVGLVREAMVTVGDVEPVHPRAADGFGVLERGDAGHVVDERVYEQVDLHAREARDIVILVGDAALEVGWGDAEGLSGALGDFALELAHEGLVLLERAAILGTDDRADFGEIGLQRIQHATQVLAVLHLAVEFLVHLIGIGDRGDGLAAASVGHARPRVGAVLHADAELERTEPCAGRSLALEKVFDLLVDRDAAGPAGRHAGTAHDIARQQFDAGEEATHAAHVAVAIAAHFVGETLEGQQAVAVGRERAQDFLQLKVAADLVGPEGGRDGAVGREDDDEPLTWAGGCGEGETRQAGDEGQHGGGQTGLAEKFAAEERGHGEWGGDVTASVVGAAPCSAARVAMSAMSVRKL